MMYDVKNILHEQVPLKDVYYKIGSSDLIVPVKVTKVTQGLSKKLFYVNVGGDIVCI